MGNFSKVDYFSCWLLSLALFWVEMDFWDLLRKYIQVICSDWYFSEDVTEDQSLRKKTVVEPKTGFSSWGVNCR